jgi:hypothetical protein
MAVGHPVTPVLLGQLGDLSVDDGLQFVLAVQNGFRKRNGISAEDQDLPVEVHFSGRKDHPISQKFGIETLGKISLSRDL